MPFEEIGEFIHPSYGSVKLCKSPFQQDSQMIVKSFETDNETFSRDLLIKQLRDSKRREKLRHENLINLAAGSDAVNTPTECGDVALKLYTAIPYFGESLDDQITYFREKR